MERELLAKGPVLDEKGRPIPGFSRKSTLTYNRKSIKAPPWRIKEWDFYQITNDHLCLQLTIGHAAYAGQVSMMLFDFQKGKKYLDVCRTLALPFGSLHMPANAEQDHTLAYSRKGLPSKYGSRSIFMSFEAAGQSRILTCRWKDLDIYIRLERLSIIIIKSTV